MLLASFLILRHLMVSVSEGPGSAPYAQASSFHLSLLLPLKLDLPMLRSQKVACRLPQFDADLGEKAVSDRDSVQEPLRPPPPASPLACFSPVQLLPRTQLEAKVPDGRLGERPFEDGHRRRPMPPCQPLAVPSTTILPLSANTSSSFVFAPRAPSFLTTSPARAAGTRMHASPSLIPPSL